MLPSWPSSRPIAERYTRRTQRLVRVTGTGMERRELALLSSIDAHSAVNSVTFSPDGLRIASGSSDGAVRVWDGQAGQVVLGPLQGHTESVQSVAFSPD